MLSVKYYIFVYFSWMWGFAQYKYFTGIFFRPSHGVQTCVVEDEPQWDPRHSFEVVWTTYQRVPDRNAGIKLTEMSCVRLKRKVWTSFLWFMTALWVQVNVLSDRGKSLPLNALRRCSERWYDGLGSTSVQWKRSAVLICEEDWMQYRHCLFSRNRSKATKWSEDKASYTFEQSDRSWIRHEGNPGVELMLLNFDIPNAKTSVLIVDMEKNHPEVNEKLSEVSRDNPRGKFLERKPLSTPSRKMFIKLSRICPRNPCHETKITSVRELRETSCKSLNGRDSEGHLKAWNSADDRFPSKCPTMSDEHRTASKTYDRGKTHWDDENASKLDEFCKAIKTPEGKWWRKLKTRWDFISMPASRRALCTRQLRGDEEHGVAVSNAVLHCWVCHRKHGRWNDDIRVHKMRTKRLRDRN